MLSLLTLAAFWPVLHNDFIQYDDALYVTDNPHVQGGFNLGDIEWAFQASYANWHPLTWLAHMLDAELFGMNRAGITGEPAAAHSQCAAAVGPAAPLTGALWRSALVAGLFALHPLHVESVAWAAERKDVLSTFLLPPHARGLWGVCAACAGSRQGRRAGGVPQAVAPPGAARHTARDLRPPGTGVIRPGPDEQADGGDLAFCAAAARLLALATFPRLSPPLVGHPGRLAWRRRLFSAWSAGSCLITFLAQDKDHAVRIGLSFGLRLANAIASYFKYLG